MNILSLVLLTSSVPAQTVKLEAETNHSTVEFFVPISSGLTKISGKFTDYEILIDFNDSSLVKSSIEVKINPASVNTGIPARDEDLKSPDFFDAARYPEITLSSQRIEKAGDHFMLIGKCTAHGVVREVTIPFRVTGVSKNYVMGFSGVFSIRRSDYGIGTNWKHTTDDHFIADDIEVHVDFWTRKPRPKP